METLGNILPPGVKRGERGLAAETREVSVTQRKMADMSFFFIVPLRAFKASSIIHRGHLGQRV